MDSSEQYPIQIMHHTLPLNPTYSCGPHLLSLISQLEQPWSCLSMVVNHWLLPQLSCHHTWRWPICSSDWQVIVHMHGWYWHADGGPVVVQLPSDVWLFTTPWTAVYQASLFFTISWSLPKFVSTESVMPSNHLILCCPLLLLPSIFPRIRVFFNESVLCIRCPKY